MFGVDSVLGLPLHVLLVHFAVVLVPLAAIVLIATQWRAEWRAIYGLPVTLLAIAGAGSAFLAAQTGGSLRDSVRVAAMQAGTRANFGSHPGNGNNAEIAAIVFGLSAIGLSIACRGPARLQLPVWLSNAAFSVAAVLGVIATALVIIAGHSGSALVWKDLGNFVQGR